MEDLTKLEFDDILNEVCEWLDGVPYPVRCEVARQIFEVMEANNE